MRTAICSFVLSLIAAVAYAGPENGGAKPAAPKLNDALRLKVAGLIDRLPQTSEVDNGYNPASWGSSFLPTDSKSEFQGGLLFQPPAVQSSPMRELVKLGLAALPQLLEHLDDGRRTKIRILAWGNFYVDGDNEKCVGLDCPDREPNSARCHVITVGDICYVAIGQILDQGYSAAMYIPSGNIFIRSPTHSVDLRKEIRAAWAGFTPAQHVDLLVQDMSRMDSSSSAAKRLAYYYPDVFERNVLELFKRPVRDFHPDLVWETTSELLEAKTAKDAESRFKAALTKHGDDLRWGILHGLFDGLEHAEKHAARKREQPEFDAKEADTWLESHRRLLVQLFGQKKDVASRDRDESTQCWSPLGLRRFLESLTYDDSAKVDRAAVEILGKTKNISIAAACMNRLMGRGFDAEIAAAIKGLKSQEYDFSDIEAQFGRTRLHVAVERGHRDRTSKLIAEGADVNARAARGMTPLHVAAIEGNRETADLLLAANARRDRKDDSGRTPVYRALERGHHDLAKRLLPDSVAGEGLFVAAFAGDDGAVKAALDKEPAGIDARIHAGWSALHLAAFGGHDAVVDRLLKAGAKVDVADEDDWTPLHVAVAHSQEKVVGRLLLAKADPRAKIKYSEQQPLIYAALSGNTQVAKQLVAANADPAAATANRESAAHYAASRGQVGFLEYLASLRVPLDAPNSTEKTPLHIAAESGQAKAVEFLLKHGAKIEARTKDGSRPLHLAVRMGQRDVVEALLRAGASIEAESDHGVTPLRTARGCQENEIEELLVRKGAKK